jgi:hypothetical protein
MFKGVSQYIPVVSLLYLGPFNPFPYSPLPLYLPPPPFFQQLSIHIFISSTFTDVIQLMLLTSFYNGSNSKQLLTLEMNWMVPGFFL